MDDNALKHTEGWQGTRLQGKVFAAQPDHLSLVPGDTHTVEGENQLLQVVF